MNDELEKNRSIETSLTTMRETQLWIHLGGCFLKQKQRKNSDVLQSELQQDFLTTWIFGTKVWEEPFLKSAYHSC